MHKLRARPAPFAPRARLGRAGLPSRLDTTKGRPWPDGLAWRPRKNDRPRPGSGGFARAGRRCSIWTYRKGNVDRKARFQGTGIEACRRRPARPPGAPRARDGNRVSVREPCLCFSTRCPGAAGACRCSQAWNAHASKALSACHIPFASAGKS